MKKIVCLFGVFVCQLVLQASLEAGTVAYWRFEDGDDTTAVVHDAADGVYNSDIIDVSGNGNDLSVWSTGGGGGYGYHANVATDVLPYSGLANTLSVKNTGGGPAMWCATEAMQTMTPAAFTIEATVKLENNGFKTVVGRDSLGTVTDGSDANLAALYFGCSADNRYSIKFCDVSGYWHEVVSAPGLYQGFDYGTDPDGDLAPWTSIAAVSDGSTLSLYALVHGVDATYQLIGQTDMTASGSPSTALSAGAGDGGDWDAGNWSVGRGLYNGGHGDRAYGYIDEVRISDSALIPSEFIYGPTPYYPEVTQAVDTVNGDVDVTLSWMAASDPNVATTGNAVLEDIVEQYVFVRDADSGDEAFYYLAAAGDPGTTDPASSVDVNLDFDILYEWVVFESYSTLTLTPGISTLDDVASGIMGPVWSFQAEYSIPIITADPADMLVAVGDAPETLTVEIQSLSDNITYTWYKTDVLSNENAGGIDQEVYSETTNSRTSTLVLDGNVELTDEGYYYCVVTNDSGKDIPSDVAILEVERMVAYYEFENDILDSENDNDGWLQMGDPNQTIAFDEGKFGQAASFNGENASVNIPRSVTNSFTIEMWVKSDQASKAAGYWWDGYGLVDGEVAGWSLADFGTSVCDGKFSFGISALTDNLTNIHSTTSVNDGVWHYCVATRDGETGVISIYVDGVLEGTATGPIGNRENTPTSLRIGAVGVDGVNAAGEDITSGIGNYFNGVIDSVKLYNYAMGEYEVADAYVAVEGGTVCVTSQRPSATYDFNNDCVVDLTDFAEFASNWLVCGFYPVCE